MPAALLLLNMSDPLAGVTSYPEADSHQQSNCMLLVQVLNVAIYRAIGRDGVYYGFKLGRPVPWHSGFPFNVVSHPQYVGSILSIWGCAGLYWQNLPNSSFLVLVYWSCLYVATGFQEQFL